MKHLIIIPVHNEENYLFNMLNSLITQTCDLNRIIVVDDASTDLSPKIISDFCNKYKSVSSVRLEKKQKRDIGQKIVNVFYAGLEQTDIKQYDLISKFDADLVFDKDYIERVQSFFLNDNDLGLVGGICTVLNTNGDWVDEAVTNHDHVRGALKTYRVKSFLDIGGLQRMMGWDSLDEHALRMKRWKVKCDPNLMVRHYRKTNDAIGWQESAKKNGMSFSIQRFNFFQAALASTKRGLKNKPFILSGVLTYLYFIFNYFKYDDQKVSHELGDFIRAYQMNSLKRKLGFKPKSTYE